MLHIFPERLRKLRKRRNMTQIDLAERLEISPSTVSSYERDTADPSINVLIKLSSILDVSTDYLLGLENREYVSIDGLSPENAKLAREMVANMKKKKD